MTHHVVVYPAGDLDGDGEYETSPVTEEVFSVTCGCDFADTAGPSPAASAGLVPTPEPVGELHLYLVGLSVSCLLRDSMHACRVFGSLDSRQSVFGAAVFLCVVRFPSLDPP